MVVLHLSLTSLSVSQFVANGVTISKNLQSWFGLFMPVGEACGTSKHLTRCGVYPTFMNCCNPPNSIARSTRTKLKRTKLKWTTTQFSVQRLSRSAALLHVGLDHLGGSFYNHNNDRQWWPKELLWQLNERINPLFSREAIGGGCSTLNTVVHFQWVNNQDNGSLVTHYNALWKSKVVSICKLEVLHASCMHILHQCAAPNDFTVSFEFGGISHVAVCRVCISVHPTRTVIAKKYLELPARFFIRDFNAIILHFKGQIFLKFRAELRGVIV